MNRGGDYEYAITNWEKHFGAGRIQYLFYEDLASNPRKFLQQFLDFVRPGTSIDTLFEEKIGRGVDKQIDESLRKALLVKNLSQYQFLAQKFGPGSYPEKWLQNVMLEIEGV